MNFHLVEKQNKKESIQRMNETKNNLYTTTVSIELTNSNFGYYFTAKDRRGIETKFPNGILGELFLFNK